MKSHSDGRDDEELLETWSKLTEGVDHLTEQRDRIEMEMGQRLRDRGATLMVGSGCHAALVEDTATYDHGILYAGLGEMDVVPKEFFDKGYTPEHFETQTIEARFNMTQVKMWRNRFGNHVGDVMDRARLPGRPGRLVVKKLKQKEREHGIDRTQGS